MRSFVVLPQRFWLDRLRRTVAHLVSVALNVKRSTRQVAQPLNETRNQFLCGLPPSAAAVALPLLRRTGGVLGGKNANIRRRGLSIIEVAMASALLAAAMVPILRSLTKANMFAVEIERKTQSLVLAQGKLDEIKALSIYNFGSSGSFTGNGTFPSTSYVYNVTDEDTLNPDLKKITVSVGYGGDNSVTLVTYVARRW